MEAFTGEGNKNIVDFIEEFEDVAQVCDWNEIQKYLYLRRLLRRAAKMAIEAKGRLHSNNDLKDTLSKEFGEHIASIDIHKCLRETQKQNTESYLEYLFKMQKIGNKGKIDEKSIISYIIEGIMDSPINKTILYDAKNYDELKEKMKLYEKIKVDSKGTLTHKFRPSTNINNTNSTPERHINSDTRCKICGGTGHFTGKCPHQNKGPRCFSCNSFRHLAPDCTVKQEVQSTRLEEQVKAISNLDMHVLISLINASDIQALIDTGSDVTLMKSSLFSKLECT